MVDIPQFGAGFLTVSPSQEGCPGLLCLWESTAWGWGPALPKVLGFAAASNCPSPDCGVDRLPGPWRSRGEHLTRPSLHAEARTRGTQALYRALALPVPEPEGWHIPRWEEGPRLSPWAELLVPVAVSVCDAGV